MDGALPAGKIRADRPFIECDSGARLNGSYPTLAAADTAITGLRTTQARYPLAVKAKDVQVTQAIDELKQIYRLVATPAMKVQAQTYQNDVGHQTYSGCFRCHDRTQFHVVSGPVPNKESISPCANDPH